MIGFLLGLMVGSVVGMVLIAVLVSAKERQEPTAGSIPQWLRDLPDDRSNEF